MKKRLFSIILIILTLSLIGGTTVNALTDVSYISKKDSLKILAIGNSFSEDSTEYLPWIAKDCGVKEIVVGNMYIGGCTIETHAKNARENNASYKYYKNTDYVLMSAGPTTANVSLETALKDEDWDVITLQHSSGHSGVETFYNSDLDYLIDYVKKLCPNAKIGWHMTWAYDSSCTLSAFRSNYRNNQAYMYQQITSCVQKKILPNEKIDFIIPAGTAVQNARTSYVGDNLTRDGYHLDLIIGRYIVGVTWMKSLGYSTDNLTTIPRRMKKVILPFVLECADNAINSPYAVTQSTYTYEPGTKAPETTIVTEVTTAVPDGSIAGTESMSDAVNNTNTTTSPETTEQIQTPKNNGSNEKLFIIAGIGAIAAIAVTTAITLAQKNKRKNNNS